MRFDGKEIPICHEDKVIRTNTHYLTYTRGQIGPEANPPLYRFSVKRLEFEKRARTRNMSLWDTIHTWHMNEGTTRFVEVMKEKEYWKSTRMLTEEEVQSLEPASPSPSATESQG